MQFTVGPDMHPKDCVFGSVLMMTFILHNVFL